MKKIANVEGENAIYAILIRYAIVEELAGLSARIHTCARTETDLNKCLLDWKSKGFQVTGSVCDVSSQLQRENLLNTVSSEFHGKLNILVSKHIYPHYVIFFLL